MELVFGLVLFVLGCIVGSCAIPVGIKDWRACEAVCAKNEGVYSLSAYGNCNCANGTGKKIEGSK